MLVEAGLRIGELTNLRWEHVDLDTGRIRVVNDNGFTAKGKRGREVRVWPDTLPLLQDVYAHRNKEREQIFHFHKRYWLTKLKRLTKKAGLESCTNHDLRRVCCTFLLLTGVPVPIVQQYMGHASITTTLGYYSLIPQKEISDAAVRAQAWFKGESEETLNVCSTWGRKEADSRTARRDLTTQKSLPTMALVSNKGD